MTEKQADDLVNYLRHSKIRNAALVTNYGMAAFAHPVKKVIRDSNNLNFKFGDGDAIQANWRGAGFDITHLNLHNFSGYQVLIHYGEDERRKSQGVILYIVPKKGMEKPEWR